MKQNEPILLKFALLFNQYIFTYKHNMSRLHRNDDRLCTLACTTSLIVHMYTNAWKI